MADDRELFALLQSNEGAHLDAQAAARRAMDARVRGVADARDAGWSLGQIARAITEVREQRGAGVLRPGDVTHLLALGYPGEEKSA